MSTAPQTASISLVELLAVNEAETRHWHEWFKAQPATLLDLPTAIAGTGSVRQLVLHIFAVELRYAERLLDHPDVTSYEALPTGTVDELFGIGERAREMLREYIGKASPEDLTRVIEFPTRSAGMLRASKRKCFAHAMLHGVRHWAQLAVVLREAGSPTNWHHDLLMTPVIE